jgi:membrane-associated phospholipid phosphatase
MAIFWETTTMLELERGLSATNRLLLSRPLQPSRWRTLASRTVGACRVADHLTLAYLIFTAALVIICRRNVAHWETIALIHSGLIIFILLLANFHTRGPRLLRFLSHWYPVAGFGFFFEEIGHLVHALHPGWFDAALIRFDYALFGAHPTVWLEQLSNYWLNEYMQLAYTTYLVLIPGLAAYLWWRGERRGFEVFLVSTCAAYYLSYLIFIFFPIEGPYHTLAHLQRVELAGGPFTVLINLIERHGRVHGGAFPSTHVAGSVTVLISAYRFAPRLGRVLTPLVLSICVATVYGRYHYAVDVLAGAAMGAIGCWIGARLCRASGQYWER